MSKEYQKFKCVNCEHEFISGAKKPRCSKCFSTRINKISAFSLEKEMRPQTPTTKEEPKPISKTIEQKTMPMPKQEKRNDFLDDFDF